MTSDFPSEAGARPSLVCGSCTACCYAPPFLDDGERTPFPTTRDWNQMKQVWQKRLLASPDGTCSHLTPEGCSIYSDRPNVCRRFDCRDWYTRHTRSQRRSHNRAERKVFAAAKERLK